MIIIFPGRGREALLLEKIVLKNQCLLGFEGVVGRGTLQRS